MSRRLAVLCILTFTVGCGHINLSFQATIGPTPEANGPTPYPPPGSGPNHVDHVVNDGGNNFHWERTSLNASEIPSKKK